MENLKEVTACGAKDLRRDTISYKPAVLAPIKPRDEHLHGGFLVCGSINAAIK